MNLRSSESSLKTNFLFFYVLLLLVLGKESNYSSASPFFSVCVCLGFCVWTSQTLSKHCLFVFDMQLLPLLCLSLYPSEEAECVAAKRRR